MSSLTRKINRKISLLSKDEKTELMNSCGFTKAEQKIFELKYIRNKTILHICLVLFYSDRTVERRVHNIKEKVAVHLDNKKI